MIKTSKADEAFDRRFPHNHSLFTIEQSNPLGNRAPQPKDLKVFIEEQRVEILEGIKKEIASEIIIANKEGQPTSRLTSLWNKVDKII